jgi:NTE family protein
MAKTQTKALVLGGGGIAGIGWETGILFGLAERGVDVTGADVIVGTSAGSVVAAQVSSGTPLGELHDRIVFPQGESTELPAELDINKLVADWGGLLNAAGPGKELRAAIGRYALAAPTVPERTRRDVIAARLASHDWPDRDIRIVAVDAASGDERMFTSADGVELVDAVAASCAVPGIWPAMTVDGRRYIDGGVRSSTNADLVADYDVVLIVAPVPDLMTVDPAIDKATKKLEKSKRTLVIRPDEASVAAIGFNPLDPATGKPSAQAGRAQAESEVDAVRAVWEGS